MHRFHIDPTAVPPFIINTEIPLPDHVSHQIRNVLRLRTGAKIELFTGDGDEWTAQIVGSVQGSVRTHRETARLIDQRTPEVEMQTQVTMVMALTRPQRYELALAKCTELGAYEFIPIVSERVQRSDSTIGPNRKSRWDRIVIEAAELSGRVRIPQIAPPKPLDLALDHLSSANSNVVLLWEEATGPLLTDLLATFRDSKNGSGDIALVFGPVGGFSNDEAERAVASGALIASLGPRILRTETAAIASMAVAAQDPRDNLRFANNRACACAFRHRSNTALPNRANMHPRCDLEFRVRHALSSGA